MFSLKCERDWSAHCHICLKISNRLVPATTEMLVYVDSNVVAATCDANENKIIRCLLGKCIYSGNVTANGPAAWRHTSLLAGHSQGEARVAESPSRQVAHLSRVA